MNSASELLTRATRHHQAGELADAEPLYRAVLAVEPHHAQAHNDLGVLLQQRSQFDEAAGHFEAVLQVLPGCADAYVNLGTNFHARNRLDDAAAAYRAALALAPAAETHHALGRVLLQQGQLDPAWESFQAALRLDPDCAALLVNAARTLRLQGRLDDAVDYLTRARALDPQNTDTLCDLGARLKDLGRVDEALGVFREALAIDPTFAPFHGNLLYSLNVRGGDPTRIFAEHRSFGQTVCDPLTAGAPPHHVDHTVARRLRVGYVSAQFWAHAVNAFSEPILAAHDRSKFEVFCYDNGSPTDATNQRLRGLVDHWRSISLLDDEQAATLVRNDRIDILVDLCGHIAGNRLLLFARRPAPVQVTYLGYQNTTGMQAMDYRLTDDWSDPPRTSEAFYTEELARLPRSFFCYQPWPEAPPIGPLPARANGFVTFGSFNDFAKCTPAALPVWAKLLQTVRQFAADDPWPGGPLGAAANRRSIGGTGHWRGAIHAGRSRAARRVPGSPRTGRHRPGPISVQRPHHHLRRPVARRARGDLGRTHVC